jgi:hypothetical protein
MMCAVVLADGFEPRRAVAKIGPLHQTHFLQQMHQAVIGRQIAPAAGISEKIPRVPGITPATTEIKRCANRLQIRCDRMAAALRENGVVLTGSEEKCGGLWPPLRLQSSNGYFISSIWRARLMAVVSRRW